MQRMATLRWLTAGESHGPGLTVIVEGTPAGLALSEDLLRVDLARRQQGYGRGGRQRIETDHARIVGGVRHGLSTGAPIALWIENKDFPHWQDDMSVSVPDAPPKPVTRPRPGHADLAGALKYRTHDLRNVLERASARETAARVAAGAIARALLLTCGIEVLSRVLSIGGTRFGDPAATHGRIFEAAREGTTLGGSFEVWAPGVPPGLGSYAQWDLRLDGRLAQALMSIPAIRAVSLGDGLQIADETGQEAHDTIAYADGEFVRLSNRSGGVEGGVSNGENIVVRAWMKPLPTQKRELPSIDLVSKLPVDALNERHDICAVESAAVIGEAMMCLTLAATLLETFGGDSMSALHEAFSGHRAALEVF